MLLFCCAVCHTEDGCTSDMHAALLHQDGYQPAQMASHTVQRTQIKDMQVLPALSSTLSTATDNDVHRPSPAIASSSLQTPLQPNVVSSQQLRRQQSQAMTNDSSISTSSLQHALPHIADPAILSVRWAGCMSAKAFCH